ncbi:hypothetical protein GCM10023170_010810 [Phytohabitans houttuyneae]|uniref:Uncharacterized protein n=1 Tax=Phytohabitans houttuyneae TaxID=1076126 RepID=A0A6V8KAI1_9ACTN|nr:hypothetical protein Phou_036510 [Phytohabitans houttuyneae]
MVAAVIAAATFVVLSLIPNRELRDRDFVKDDPHGASACAYYEMWVNGLLPANEGWARVRGEADQAETGAVRSASDPAAFHAACVDAGRPMGPYKPPPGF